MDSLAVTELLQRHARLIHKVAYAYCRNGSDREDVVQEVAVQLWRAHDRYDGRCQETTWVYRIALNVAISFHRRQRRHRDRREAFDEQSITIAETPRDADVELLLQCIDELSHLDKALVLLHLDGNDHATIADVLGISVSNVGTRLHRCKAHLRTALTRRSGSPQPEDDHGTR